jgi:NAD(P)-dependent dehydrogenase (short-subunit alcohol dehydrogenase family)
MGSGKSKYVKAPEIASKHFHAFVDGLLDLSGRVTAFTGCTTGTGYACAKACLTKEARVIMLNRESDRVKAAQDALSTISGASDRSRARSRACLLAPSLRP